MHYHHTISHLGWEKKNRLKLVGNVSVATISRILDLFFFFFYNWRKKAIDISQEESINWQMNECPGKET